MATIHARLCNIGGFDLTGSALAVAVADVTTPEISNDKITFGSGNGDFVKLAGFETLAEAAATATENIAVAATATDATSNNELGDLSNNLIKFGSGNGDFVLAAVATNTNNKIHMGDGTGDYVSLLGAGDNNSIFLGNGSGDAVTLGAGAGGDTIITGTGLDTVTVGSHTSPDTFGFALNTNGASFTAITGAQVGDHLISGNTVGNFFFNHLGNDVVNSVTGAKDLGGFIASLVLTNGKTYVGNNGTDTFVVTDYQGQLGAVELVGVVFAGHTFERGFTLKQA
jgi:hypothetical protein